MTAVFRSPLLRYFLAVILFLGASFSAVFGVASLLFSRGDKRSVELAARLVPFNSEYLARLSSYHPENRTALLHKAAANNPYSEQVWLQLGFDAEFYHHNYADAERYYLQAASVSRLFLPRWTLTNFYFRRQDEANFLRWARLAMEVTPYTAAPIFTELWLMHPDGKSIAAEIPNRPEILEQYFDFLMTARQFAFVPAVIQRLLAVTPASQAGLYGMEAGIGPGLDTLLGASYSSEALQVWSDLSRAHWIPFPTPTQNKPLTNGNFDSLFGHGFDWFLIGSSGISLQYQPGVHEIAAELSGDQAETCQILLQWLPLGASRSYHLDWKQENSGLSNPSGLLWRVHASNFDAQSPDLLAGEATGWTFKTPPGTVLAILTLEYHRPLGQTKAKGTFRLQQVTMEPG